MKSALTSYSEQFAVYHCCNNRLLKKSGRVFKYRKERGEIRETSPIYMPILLTLKKDIDAGMKLRFL